MNIKKGFVFVIDTNQYAGNFEREMCAHLTGVIGECEVGEEYVDKNITKMFDEDIQQCGDDHGCYRPCEIVSNEDRKSQSVGIFFNKKPTEEQIETMKSRSYTFNKKRKELESYNRNSPDIEILGFRLLEVTNNVKNHEV